MIGTHGSTQKRLESEIGCRIEVNKQEGAFYSCDVLSNSQSGAENGARFLMEHIIRELHIENHTSAQEFNYKLRERNAFVWRIYLPLPKEVFDGKR